MLIARPEDSADFFNLPFEELGEVFFSGVLLTKLSAVDQPDPVTLRLSLSDLFLGTALEGLTPNSTVSVHRTSRPGRDIATFLSVLFGELIDDAVSHVDAQDAKSLGEFFGAKLRTVLGYLRDGDSCDLEPAIESFEQEAEDEFGVPVFSVQVCRQKFVDAFKTNVVNCVNFQEKAHELMSSFTDLSQPAVAIDKQLGFLRDYLDTRSNTTGETAFSFLLNNVNFRRVIQPVEGAGGQAIMPTPLSSNAGLKAILPFVLAMKGELDIDQVKIKSPVQQINAIEIQFSIRRPAVRNVLGATYCALTPEKRQLMSEAEIKVYEGIVRQLQANLCFVGKPKLEQEFAQFASWAVKQIAYCLEEPSFLKTPALNWLKSHDGVGYQRMEDDFFLPFLYERLRDKFGPLVSKKPERFGGNVDILFGDVPVELKARRGQKTALVDTLIDEKFKPTGQAASYAALTGLGCVLVLDVPTGSPSVTNLTACVKVVTRRFPEAQQPTSVVVFIFQCDTPRPSDAT
ncbi:hypothetical protein [Burkholderia ubonensis]|uniref:hypothetical protein n=1 Tax=Burkholderia ubonensis TaxID=101571 RepID=UPI00075DD96E|nr:hypothetical protein [Burkholderia ubonensis]AOI71137.1 hypothetical protein WI31_17265 [Burkholderia ubonensis]KUZ20239.1 hypothetical protein WI30_35335 [Burkholderia ubonensis]KUZ24975.1 hypothetical protein WI29_09220 [Burkholderia ubonensis]KUZ27387.1 hypothetical protein WI32_28070 [Burkholderia ubonensis]KUZ50499.1 hypothetical protein WI33_14595 [Burkholderia ubonensis]